MGRTTRWLRSLWSGKKEKKESRDYSHSGGYIGGDDRREKKRWSFGKAAKDPAELVLGQNASRAAAVEAAWFRSFYAETEKEQSKHVIAVAAATAAAADAAVAAAQAAVAVVRLTNQGRCGGGGLFLSARDCESSAVKIQRAFRGYLARKALRALKALVKLQALVRGYLVRRQAAATLHSMQALIRAQAAARAQRAQHTIRHDRKLLPEPRAWRSIERFDDARSENTSSLHSRRLSANLDSFSNGGWDRSPKVVEIDTFGPKSRSSCRSNPSAVDPADDWHSGSISSPLPCQIPPRISIPDCRYFQDHDWCLPGDRHCRLSATAQSTPRYLNPSGNPPPPLTPAKSSCGASGGVIRRFMNVPSSPNYMANTQSFVAKSRSQSAPKQRPELRKRLPLTEVMLESRASLSGVGMQRSCSRVQEAFNFKSAVVGRLDRSSELGREAEREFYSHNQNNH